MAFETLLNKHFASPKHLSENDPFPRNNGAILTLAQIIKPVMSSAAEAELGALYINAREVVPQ